MKRILIIKHGSLGDIVFALPVMNSICKHFHKANLDLLSEKKYLNLLKDSGFFHKLIEDNRSKNIFVTVFLLIKLLVKKYDLIIDLQNSSRTSYYNFFFRIFSKTQICSSRNFAHIRYKIPSQGNETTTQGLFHQIKLLNISKTENIQYDWLNCSLDQSYKNKIVLFIPGVSKNGKYKQWEPNKFGKLAKYCEEKNYQICVVGTTEDSNSISPILKNCKQVINKIGQSPPNLIYSISKKSKLIVTNDTGPGHIASLSKSNILWIVNDNKITKANIENNKYNYKLISSNINDLSIKDAIKFIKDNNLL